MVLDAGIDPNNQVNTGQDNIVRLGYDLTEVIAIYC